MAPAEAATQLCTCVYDCNVPLLRRFIKAGILVNAGNFDSRTALHVAAAEGNVAAVRLCNPRTLSTLLLVRRTVKQRHQLPACIGSPAESW